MNTLSDTNYFELFGLAPRFTIDMHSLEQSFRQLQSELHPDRHAGNSEAEQRVALQKSTQVNDAYRTLRNPVTRARCLIDLAGVLGLEAKTLTPGFLMAQMEWRESIEDARHAGDVVALDALSKRLKHKVSIQEKDLASALDDEANFQLAEQRLNELFFYQKLRNEIDDALDQLDN
ncbi:MAG: Fe-S protein assembly co-chaperone HscB [Methylophilaceae bacterium]